MSNTTPKPGDIARKAAKREAAERAPVGLSGMLGEGSTVILADGRELQLVPIVWARRRQFLKAVEVLGDYAMLTLAAGDDDRLASLNDVLGRSPDGEMKPLTPENVRTAIALAELQASEEHDAAALDIMQLAFNGKLPDGTMQTVDREELAEILTPADFPVILRRLAEESGIRF